MPTPRCFLFRLLAAAALSAPASGCTTHGLVDGLMTLAHRPEAPDPRRVGPYEVLAGDFHCHVTPPDGPRHVSRGLDRTIELAKEEGLDFVVLTPHVRAGFLGDEILREAFVEEQRALRRALVAQDEAGVVFVQGFEYTDFIYGHLGMAFADLESVLEEVPPELARERPELFFERWIERGGTLVINHPFLMPLDSIISVARWDLSWSPWTARGPFPAEIAVASRLAQGVEVFNLAIAGLRDKFLVGDPTWSVRAGLAEVDRRIILERRRIAPVGGSDSHSDHLRATTFVLAEGRRPGAIRDALLAGRVCVRSPEACSLEVRAPGGGWVGVGGALRTEGPLEARARGGDIEIVWRGEPRAFPRSGEIVALEVPGSRCSVVRARASGGYSGPIYVNCPFAEARPRDAGFDAPRP